MDDRQKVTDAKNVEFWNELCGSGLARMLGITEVSPETLRRFDEAYLSMYPYLESYVSPYDLKCNKVLEIGLGYGTLGQVLAMRGCNYHGLDIAQGPVDMMRYRLNKLGQMGDLLVKRGSAKEIPYPDETFDFVYSIGCLHHTGNLNKSVSEIYRVLVPEGKAIVMLYNLHSFRQAVLVHFVKLRGFLKGDGRSIAERVRAMYDTDMKGEAAPFTEYVSRKSVKQLFRRFSKVQIDIRNFDSYALFKGRVVIPREKLLNNIGRVLGLDLYITADK